MGYYTQFVISRVEGPEDQYNALIEELDKELGTDFATNGSESLKWYDYQKDLARLTKKYPEVVLQVEGRGEDFDDIWNEYWKDGKMFQEGVSFAPYMDVKNYLEEFQAGE